MHEYSIVRALIEQCEEHAKQNRADAISKVVVQVGVLSGVEPDLLETAFETFREASPVCRRAELVLNIQAVTVFCAACGRESRLQAHHYVCPYCQSAEVTITDGKEMFLMQLEME